MINAIVLFVASVLIVACNAEDSQERMTRLMGQCMQESGATQDDLGPIMAREIPTKREVKCFMACFHKALGYQTPDGKLNPEGTWAIGEKLKAINPDTFAKFKVVADTCLAEVKDMPDACNNAANIMTCYVRVQKEVGLSMTDVMV